MRRPVALLIRDGWGFREAAQGNAVAAAQTPNIDRYKACCPWTTLECAGEAVGLPEGYQGSSEVGHLNMGAGRVVVQELKRIDDGLRDGTMFEAPRWRELAQHVRTNGGRLHLLGLLQDEGVHAHQEHLFKIMRRARNEMPDAELVLHPFLDGRDTPPRSALEFLAKLRAVMQEVGRCRIGTIMGRYYAMDRSENWGLTDAAYRCIVRAEGSRAASAEAEVRRAYADDATPDNVEMSDEYVRPCALGDYDGVHEGDGVMHTNYRQDRAIQLSRAFVDPAYPGRRDVVCNLRYLGLTRYYDEFEPYLLAPMEEGGNMQNLLGKVLAQAGIRQLRIAETQKFRHVTSFFNGKSTKPFAGEDQVNVPSRFDPATFASHPEMDAFTVTEALLKRLEINPYGFIAVNFANGDMVGHTGNIDAARRAIEVVDACVGTSVDRLLALDAHVLITSDHGNAEEMLDAATGMPKTSHTLNPVECIYVSRESASRRLRACGKLADIAPTVLFLMGLEQPPEMTGQNLVLV